jgi:[ribosomal protein S5]-alanine N-acetyltransferase
MIKATPLETERLLLLPLSRKHATEEYVSWLNDPEVYKYLETGGDYTLEKLNEFLKEVEEKNIYFWGIHLKENLKHIGNIKIDPVNTKNKLGEYGILMGNRSEWKKGYAKEASTSIINFCFDVIGLRKVTLGVMDDNTSAVQLYQNLGFKTEGVYEKHGIYNGKYCNCIRMALFNPAVIYQ